MTAETFYYRILTAEEKASFARHRLGGLGVQNAVFLAVEDRLKRVLLERGAIEAAVGPLWWKLVAHVRTHRKVLHIRFYRVTHFYHDKPYAADLPDAIFVVNQKTGRLPWKKIGKTARQHVQARLAHQARRAEWWTPNGGTCNA